MSTTIIIGPVRTSFFHCFEPKAPKGSTKLQYSTQLLVDLSDEKNMKLIEAAIEEAKEEGKAILADVPAKKLRNPINKGEEEYPGNPDYKGKIYLNASNTRKPEVVKRKNKETIAITDEEEAYSGMYVYASINFFPYNNVGAGIGCSLQHILKYKDGPRLDGRVAAEKAFATVDFDETEETEEESTMRESRSTTAATSVADTATDTAGGEVDPFAD